MDWFETLTGFRETNYEDTRSKLKIVGTKLHSPTNGKSYEIGDLALMPLYVLREKANPAAGLAGRLKVSVVIGDVRRLHQSSENAAALFQVASQFNLLEMVSPSVTPEHGVTRYQNDPTQGPACAIAAGAATIYRNYFAPVRGILGQTADRQLDGLAGLGEALSRTLGKPVSDLWSMQNGYALCSRNGLDAIAGHISALPSVELDVLRGKLCIGIHWDVEVTDMPGVAGSTVSQAFCSALPVAYTSVPPKYWKPFASLILEAAYEATLWATVLNARRGASNIVFITSLGGGAFGNDDRWIDAAIRRALKMISNFNLEVRLVSYGTPSRWMSQLARDFS